MHKSLAEEHPVARFQKLYHSLNKDSIHLVEDVYADNIVFIDPFHRIEGLTPYLKYCADMYENVSRCEFEFHTVLVEADTAILTWTMTFVHHRLNGGKPVIVDGASELKFNDKVYFHKDYFDGGALLYEHVPVLGWAISALKKRFG